NQQAICKFTLSQTVAALHIYYGTAMIAVTPATATSEVYVALPSTGEKTDYTFLMKTTYSFAPHWIGELIKDEDFCQAVRRAWREFYPSQVQPWMDYIDNHLLPCQEALEQDKIRWNLTNTETLPQRVDKLKSALQANIEWFNNHLPGEESSVTSISQANSTPVVGIEYVNPAGMRSTRPWSGLNIVVYTHADGTTTTGKTVIR
ncbi:MAG: hypothetical protein IJ613_00165, partial [Muribaculaceae bacterium]|nr:hypothetical protein [Muribaculaceae bacterium]